ncbi:hypothetical protein OAI33_15185, partial [Pirellulaceae bacterium]|nr:hypothetical protein [Pirellulaceae bacterium]
KERLEGIQNQLAEVEILVEQAEGVVKDLDTELEKATAEFENSQTHFLVQTPDIDTDLAANDYLVIPTQLLGCFQYLQKAEIQFDQTQQIFIENEPAISYGRARIYCDTIDSVPNVVQKLSTSGYAVLSEKNRIDEIHSTNNSLQLLVIIVGLGVIGFGILTVFSVLSDSTDRKRGTIGILRVMGVSRIGLFYVVVLRAGLIGIAAGIFSILCGLLIATALSSRISITFESAHVAIILTGALFCSGAGAILPAFKASQLDPFDAIQEGKFH